MQYMNERQVMELLSIKQQGAIYKWIEKFDFPKPIKIGPKTNRWDMNDIVKWMEGKKDLKSG